MESDEAFERNEIDVIKYLFERDGVGEKDSVKQVREVWVLPR